jgi:hypothetical protein
VKHDQWIIEYSPSPHNDQWFSGLEGTNQKNKTADEEEARKVVYDFSINERKKEFLAWKKMLLIKHLLHTRKIHSTRLYSHNTYPAETHVHWNARFRR